MDDKSFTLLVAVGAGIASLLAFVFKTGAGLPVRVWPFSTKEQSVRATAWIMLAIAVVALIVWATK